MGTVIIPHTAATLQSSTAARATNLAVMLARGARRAARAAPPAARVTHCCKPQPMRGQLAREAVGGLGGGSQSGGADYCACAWHPRTAGSDRGTSSNTTSGRCLRPGGRACCLLEGRGRLGGGTPRPCRHRAVVLLQGTSNKTTVYLLVTWYSGVRQPRSTSHRANGLTAAG